MAKATRVKSKRLSSRTREKVATPKDESLSESTGYHDTRKAEYTSFRPKTPNQKRCLQAIDSHDLTILIGPAGVGKTFLAVYKAVEALLEHKVSKICLTRPIVESGESLGYLPGDMREKVDPYFRPIYDCLAKLMTPGHVDYCLSHNIIEIVPLAYMRGRTLENAFIILDEAQNTTIGQMKMFLTRAGAYSKIVITGDVTQIDLAYNQHSGLVHAIDVLADEPMVEIFTLDDADIQRSSIVSVVLKAFDKHKHTLLSNGEAT
jgi:phosphate starvation-inducible protein PhoH and related proteins